MRRPSLLRVSTSDSEGPSQRQIWLSSTWAFVVGIGGAAAVASGYKFTVAAGLLSVLVLTHGIGSYAAKLGGHKRHRDALMFVGAQDLSVLAALLLLAATGPGGLSVDAKYGKGN